MRGDPPSRETEQTRCGACALTRREDLGGAQAPRRAHRGSLRLGSPSRGRRHCWRSFCRIDNVAGVHAAFQMPYRVVRAEES